MKQIRLTFHWPEVSHRPDTVPNQLLQPVNSILHRVLIGLQRFEWALEDFFFLETRLTKFGQLPVERNTAQCQLECTFAESDERQGVLWPFPDEWNTQKRRTRMAWTTHVALQTKIWTFTFVSWDKKSLLMEFSSCVVDVNNCSPPWQRLSLSTVSLEYKITDRTRRESRVIFFSSPGRIKCPVFKFKFCLWGFGRVPVRCQKTSYMHKEGDLSSSQF